MVEHSKCGKTVYFKVLVENSNFNEYVIHIYVININLKPLK